MKTILYVEATTERARLRFEKLVESLPPKSISMISIRNMEITTSDAKYTIAPLSYNEDKFTGMTFNNIIIDDLINIPDERLALLNSRIRK